MTEKDWPRAELEHLLERSAAGTVAVARSTDGTRLVPECKLDGAYTEVQGEAGSGRFWATNRLLFKTSELGGACSTATHEVAVFAVSGLPPTPARSSGGTAVRDAGGLRFSSLLLPLACPPVNDAAAAAGCLGRGLTGTEREKRALELSGTPHGESEEDFARRFEVYALMPDQRGISYLGDYTKHPLDCYLKEQLRRLTSSDPPSEWPRFSTETWARCDMWPPFLECFPGLFDPAPGVTACWRPAKT